MYDLRGKVVMTETFGRQDIVFSAGALGGAIDPVYRTCQ